MKLYIKYIIFKFLKLILIISSIFLLLILFLNLFEEINFFKDKNTSLYFSLFLNIINAPSILFNIFPFIFLISAQFLIINLLESEELITLKNFGVSNIDLIKIISLITFILGFLMIIIFYNFSSKMKHLYLELKNDFASDKKYLAVITENGLWIKDEINNQINIINSEMIYGKFLKNVLISQFDKDFNIIRYIYSPVVNIEDKIWIMEKSTSFENNQRKIQDDFRFSTNFNSEKINTLFSNLDSLTIWELFELKKSYKSVGYSINEIDLHLQKLYSYPLYLITMVLFAFVLMINIKNNKPKLFYLLIGIFLSVIIFYINHFFQLLGENEKLPIHLSVWLPNICILILTTIGLIRINEK